MRSQSPTQFSRGAENAPKRSRSRPRRSRGRRASSRPSQGGSGMPRRSRRTPGSPGPSTTPKTDFRAAVQRPGQQFQETLEARRASMTPRTVYHFPGFPETSPQPSQATLFGRSYNLGPDSRSAPVASSSRGRTQVAELRGDYEQAQRRIWEAEASPLYQGLLRDRRTVEDFEMILSYFPASTPVDPAGHFNERQIQSLFNQHLAPRGPPELRLPTLNRQPIQSLFNQQHAPRGPPELRLPTFNRQPSTRSMQFGRSSRSSVPSFAPPDADRFRLGDPSRPLSPAEESTASRRHNPVSNRARGVSERAMQRPADRLGSFRAPQEGTRPESDPSVRRAAPFRTPRYHGIAPPAELPTHPYEFPAPWTSLHRSPSTPDFTTPASTTTSAQQPPEINFDMVAARFDALNEEYDALRGPPAPRTPPTSSRPLAPQPYVEDADDDEAGGLFLPD